MSLWVNIVRAIHLVIVLGMVIAPFYSERMNLALYVIIVPMIVLHWVTSDNTCVLTLIEKRLRQEAGEKCDSDSDLFIGSLVSPVYDVHKSLPKFSDMIYILTLLLWLYAVFRLTRLYQGGGLVAIIGNPRNIA